MEHTPEHTESSEQYHARISSNINAVMASVESRVSARPKLPEFLPEYENLRGKKITMVDNDLSSIELITPEISVATDGNASAVHHTGEFPEELATKIAALQPDIILMDYSLEMGINGAQVIAALKEQGSTAQIIAFSDSEESNQKLQKAGAIGAVKKQRDGNMKAVCFYLTK